MARMILSKTYHLVKEIDIKQRNTTQCNTYKSYFMYKNKPKEGVKKIYGEVKEEVNLRMIL
jgi:hypothetical protein